KKPSPCSKRRRYTNRPVLLPVWCSPWHCTAPGGRTKRCASPSKPRSIPCPGTSVRCVTTPRLSRVPPAASKAGDPPRRRYGDALQLQRLRHEDAVRVLAIAAERCALDKARLAVQATSSREEVHASRLERNPCDATATGVLQRTGQDPRCDSAPSIHG